MFYKISGNIIEKMTDTSVDNTNYEIIDLSSLKFENSPKIHDTEPVTRDTNGKLVGLPDLKFKFYGENDIIKPSNEKLLNVGGSTDNSQGFKAYKLYFKKDNTWKDLDSTSLQNGSDYRNKNFTSWKFWMTGWTDLNSPLKLSVQYIRNPSGTPVIINSNVYYSGGLDLGSDGNLVATGSWSYTDPTAKADATDTTAKAATDTVAVATATATVPAMGHFRIADGYVLGGDCDSNFQTPFANNDDASLTGCAEECLKNEKCQRFSFGKINKKAEPGLGCRISTDGKCGVTVDRFQKEKDEGKTLEFDEKLYGLNFYNGQLYDKLSTDEINKVKTNFKSNVVVKSSSSSTSVVNNKVVSSEQKSKVLEIVDGKVVTNKVNGEDLLNKDEVKTNLESEESIDTNQEEGSTDTTSTKEEGSSSTIYIIIGIVLLLAIIAGVYFMVSKDKTESN